MPEAHRPLSEQDLLRRMPLRRLGRRVFVLDSVDSTNTYLLQRAAEAGDGAIASAEFQTAGRGRRGNRWEAARGSSVLLSVLLLEPPDSPLLSRAALLGALAACEAIDATTDCSPSIRWPNDLALNGRKLGGVLVETSPLQGDAAGRLGLPTGGRAVALGIGINTLQQRGHFRGELAAKATSLECESAGTVDRAAVAAGLLARLDHWLVHVGHVGPTLHGVGHGGPTLQGFRRGMGLRQEVGQGGLTPPEDGHEGGAGQGVGRGGATPARHGWAEAHAAWQGRCLDLGTRVTLVQDGRTWVGTAVDIDPEGSLTVELDAGGRKSFAPETTSRPW